MLLVKTKIGPSKIAGTGLFAAEFIPKGTSIWRFEDGFDMRLSKEQFAALPEVAQKAVLNYCYFNELTQHYVICSDDARFINHADDPNCSSSTDDYLVDFALRDIQPGEEMTQNYNVFDGHTGVKLSGVGTVLG